VFATKNFANVENDTFKEALIIPDGTASDVIKLEVLVCDDISNLTPFQIAATYSTAE